MVIYRATNKINGKEYIGQTVRSLEKRKYDHIKATLAKKDNHYFHNAIRKYGSDNFVWKTLIDCDTIEELNRLEVYYIKLYGTFNNGYNLTKGGGGTTGYNHTEEAKKKMSIASSGEKSTWYGKHHSDETKKKISEKLVGENNPMYGKYGEDGAFYGKTHTEDSKLKMSEAKKGKKASKEARQKMSESCKGEKNHNYGRHPSEETKRRMSEAKKGTKVGKDNPAARAVIIDNKYFDTIKKAAKYLGIIPDTVSDRIKRQIPGYQYT